MSSLLRHFQKGFCSSLVFKVLMLDTSSTNPYRYPYRKHHNMNNYMLTKKSLMGKYHGRNPTSKIHSFMFVFFFYSMFRLWFILYVWPCTVWLFQQLHHSKKIIDIISTRSKRLSSLNLLGYSAGKTQMYFKPILCSLLSLAVWGEKTGCTGVYEAVQHGGNWQFAVTVIFSTYFGLK